MIKFYNKIVRDGIPDILAETGSRAGFQTLTGDALIEALERKLAEELAEYLETRTIEELADVQEVLYALTRLRGHRLVVEARARKFNERGGFDQGVYLLFADIRGDGSGKPG